jgi:hypothetical protein
VDLQIRRPACVRQEASRGARRSTSTGARAATARRRTGWSNADIVPRPRNLRNTPFVDSVSYARLHESIKYGVEGTAMPAAGFDFALDDRAIGDLVNYVWSLNGRDGAPADAAAAAPAAPGN